MKTVIPFIAAITFSSFFFVQCSKDRIEQKQQINEYEPINNYFDTKKQEEQEFVIDTNGQGPIIGNQGTKIWCDKSKLMYPNGDSVYYPYTVKLVELYTPKDMIYYQMPTVASGNLLTTGGEVRIRAFKNGQELVLRPNKTWTVEMPNSTPLSGMNIYYGTINSNIVNWIQNPNEFFTTTSYGYVGEISRLGWIGCGKLAVLTGTSFSNFTFSSTTDNLQNVAIFMYYHNLKSLMQVYNQSSGNAPVGDTVKIVMMGINSSQQLYYFYQKMPVSSTNTQLNISLSPITDASMTAILDSL
ncbi:MAG TPA: hypothetical protein PLP65_00380 [Bacteroidales bacterium]|nr:hypothetical protein [Bacteroidales bacterium]